MPVGYDNLSLNSQLLYHLALDEIAVGAGVVSHDKARPHHTSLLHGGSWNNLVSGLPYIDLSPNPDWIDCGAVATADLDFTSGDYSMCAWINPDLLVGTARIIMVRRSSPVASGWSFYVTSGGAIIAGTYQAGDNQHSYSPSGIVTVGNWHLCGMSRSGTTIRIFMNGYDSTQYGDSHGDPDPANNELHIGVDEDEATYPFDGQIAGGRCGPRIWGRCLSSAEMLAIFNRERHWFGI